MTGLPKLQRKRRKCCKIWELLLAEPVKKVSPQPPSLDWLAGALRFEGWGQPQVAAKAEEAAAWKSELPERLRKMVSVRAWEERAPDCGGAGSAEREPKFGDGNMSLDVRAAEMRGSAETGALGVRGADVRTAAEKRATEKCERSEERADKGRSVVRAAGARTADERATVKRPDERAAVVRAADGRTAEERCGGRTAEARGEKKCAAVGQVYTARNKGMVLGAMRGRLDTSALSFVEVLVNGRKVRALVDTGASHNFVKLEVADAIRLKKTSCDVKVKAVNSQAKAAAGIASGVTVHIGRWTGKIDFTVMPLDDFEMILGQDFLRRQEAVLLSFADKLVIFKGKRPSVVKTVAGKPDEQDRFVSAVKAKKTAWWSEM